MGNHQGAKHQRSPQESMTFGLFLNTGAWLGHTHSEVFERTSEEVALAEALGYYDVWVSEHHFIPFGINASALTLAAFLLGRTRRLRVGTAVTLTPHYHPIQLAEQVALLDQVSAGRLDFGIGRGGYLQEFEVFGTPVERWNDEVEATVDVLLGAWTKDTVESRSRWFPFPATTVSPRPLTRPYPPLFLATRTPASIAYAARHGLPLLHYWGTPVEARQRVEAHYASTRARDGEQPPRHVHSLIVLVVDDEARTRRTLYEHLITAFRAGDWPHVP
jgi:alkanesulfonate monooxygenase SsuD/methylene tetrahydromethanopterin reductase-like flavin-dependent oxidoreductase (luciferase family)